MASSSVQGLSSGIQWQDLVDQLIKVDTTNMITPLTNKITASDNKSTAWSSYGTAVSTLQSTLKNLANGSVFNALSVNVPSSPTTGRGLVTATASPSAAPGTYGVQVLDTAAAQQLSGNVVSDPTAALGVAGQIAVGGRMLTIASSDSLNAVRDKINALNTGTSASHISASVLYSGGTSARLVLTSDIGGSSGLDLRDVRASSADTSALTALGFIDGKTANIGTDGAVRSALYTSSSLPVGPLVSGATAYPAATTILVNGHGVSVDVSTKSLTDIAAAINAQSANSASVESTVIGGVTKYNLKISGSVAATADAGSQPTLDLLGLSRGTTGVVKQTARTANELLDSVGATATGSSLLLGLKVAGGIGAQSGDTFTIAGTKTDGTAVSISKTVNGTATIDDLLSDISAAFSTGSRPVTASIVGGRIQLVDTVGGDSRLTFSMSANNESAVAAPSTGSNLSFGSTSLTASGRARELTAGRDARVIVNGVTISRPTNTITDAITGVTLNVLQAEAGTTIQVGIARDNNAVSQAVQAVVTAYNTTRTLVNNSTAADGALAYNSAMRSSFNALKATVLATLNGLPAGSPYDHAALIGLTVDKTGTLNVDTAALNAALSQNPAGVKALFQSNGAVTGSNFSYGAAGSATVAGGYDVNITRAATQSSVSSTAANFTYAAGTDPDTLTISDAFTGISGSISLVTGDTPDSVAAKLNTLFQTKGIRLSATNASGTLKINTLDYGSLAKFTIAYSSPDSTPVASQLGIAAGTVSNGLDVQGTYSNAGGTYAATGRGQALTGSAGSNAAGLIMLYTGSADSASGHVDYSPGIAGLMSNVASNISAANGTVASQTLALTNQKNALSTRQASVQSRLDARKAALLAQYTAMEAALSKIQSQATYLTQQINSIQALQSSK